MDLNTKPAPARRLIAVKIPDQTLPAITEAAPDEAYEANEVQMPEEMGESITGDEPVLLEPEEPNGPTEEELYQYNLDQFEEDIFDVLAPPEPEYFTRDCPLPTCQAQARVPKEGDTGDVLGIGMSIQSATTLESLLTGHLESHTLGEWVAALSYYQGGVNGAPVAAAGVVYPQDVTPGAAHRDPARQALVDAVDARLSGKRPTAQSSPADIKAFDDAQRANREARREFAKNMRSTIQPWSPDQGEGVVGMKR